MRSVPAVVAVSVAVSVGLLVAACAGEPPEDGSGPVVDTVHIGPSGPTPGAVVPGAPPPAVTTR